MEDLRNYVNSIRRDFATQSLDESSVESSPYKQFEKWFEEAVGSQILDPYAMNISTVNAVGKPSSRIVYLRDISEDGLIFYTNYHSNKGNDLEDNNNMSILFFWAELERQIRIEGKVEKVSDEVSDKYFAARPRESQLGAWASEQSEVITNRQQLEERVAEIDKTYENKEVPRPPHWGGYQLLPDMFEYWQGRPSRLHDRVRYLKQKDNTWAIDRLSP